MIISTFGSKICDDAVGFSHNTITNANRLVEISPFTVAHKYSPDRECISDTEAVQSDNPYLNMIFEKEYGNQITSLLKDKNAGRVVIDLATCRNVFVEFTFDNGKVFRITESAIVKNHLAAIRELLCKDFQTQIVSERIVNPLLLHIDELEEELSNFAEWLKEEIGSERIILLKVHNVYLYIGKNNHINVIKDKISMVNAYNDFFDRCADLLIKYISCSIIDVPVNLLGEAQIKEPSIFHFTRLYYEYIDKCLHAIDEEKYSNIEAADILSEYETRQLLQVEEVIMRPLVGQSYYKRKGKKLILIGENLVYEYKLRSQYGIIVDKKIPYSPDSKMEDVIESLQDIKDKSNEYLCVIPYVYPDTGVLEALWRCGYGETDGYITISHDPVILPKFIGHYRDYYNNEIISKSPVSCELNGCGIRMMIGTGNINNQMRFVCFDEVTVEIGDEVATGTDSLTSRLYDGASVVIGKHAYLGNRVHVRASFFDKLILGDNAYIGDETILFVGDGHAIIDIKTGNNINYDFNYSSSDKHLLTIGNNVKIGDGCFILAGSVIGDGCVVRERSLVNKKFGDNCYLAGHPAKVIEYSDTFAG